MKSDRDNMKKMPMATWSRETRSVSKAASAAAAASSDFLDAYKAFRPGASGDADNQNGKRPPA